MTSGGAPAPRERLFGLDALRAFAALAVMAGHFTLVPRMSGLDFPPMVLAAFTDHGVQLFFVLSGFLIGGLLLDILDRGPSIPAWRRFLARRWMRTLPLYMTWLLVLLCVAPPPGNSLLYFLRYATFLQNLAWPLPESIWFGVSWTLAIEEWFYLLFSALLFALAIGSGRPRMALAVVLGVFLVVPLLLRLTVGAIGGDFNLGFRAVVVLRLDAIAYGVLAVWILRSHPEALRRFRWPLAGSGVAALVVLHNLQGVMGPPVEWFAWEFALEPMAWTMLFPAAVALRAPGGALLGVVSWVADRSYPIYLVHLDMIVWCVAAVRDGKIPPMLCLPLAVAATFLVADLLHRFIEMPVIRRRPSQFPAAHAPMVPARDGHSAAS